MGREERNLVRVRTPELPFNRVKGPGRGGRVRVPGTETQTGDLTGGRGGVWELSSSLPPT